MLAQLINSEAANEPMLGKIAVGNVVRTRARYKNKTIKQIILQRDKYGNPAFDGIDTKRFSKVPPRDCIVAAKRAMAEYVIPESVYYFHNPTISTDTKHVRYVEQWVYADIGNHRFCHSEKLLDNKQ